MVSQKSRQPTTQSTASRLVSHSAVRSLARSAWQPDSNPVAVFSPSCGVSGRFDSRLKVSPLSNDRLQVCTDRSPLLPKAAPGASRDSIEHRLGGPDLARASVRHTDACHSQGCKPTGSTPKLAHVRQPRTTVVNPA